VFWSLHRCGGDVFVLDLLSVAGSRRSAVSCFCDVVHVLSCLAMLCVAGAPRATVLVSLWCRCCGVSQVMRMQALHVQGQQRWCWLRACPGSAAKHAQCQLVYLPACASVADACQSACKFLIVVAALLGQRKQFSRCPDSLACCGRGVCGVSMCGRCGAVAH
jgi:hypothetical protein